MKNKTIAKVEKYNGYPAIMINGKAYPPMMASVRHREDRKLDKEYYAGMGKGDIKIFFLLCDTEWAVPGSIALLKQEIEELIELIPDAYIVLRIGLHPSDEWIENNPDECFTYDDGSKPGIRLLYDIKGRDLKHQYSLASQKWRERATRALDETCDEIDKLPHADRIIGFFFAAGGTSEWYYNLKLEDGDRYGDFSEAFKREFGKILKEKYETVENLRKAWKHDTVTFEEPFIYGIKERFFATRFDDAYWNNDQYEKNKGTPATFGHEILTNGTNVGHFLDVDQYMGVFDFYRAWHLAVADSQIHFAQHIKKRYKNNMLTGSFYGSYGATNFFGNTAGGVLRILDSGHMDFLAAPGVYFNRQPGGFTGQREMVESFRLRNTMFIVEEDTRTHMELDHYKNLFDYYNVEDSYNVLKRDFGRNVCEDLHAWWYDNDKRRQRYRNEAFYPLFKRQQEIALEAYSKNRVKQNEIALIYDEESISLVSNRTTIEVVEMFRNYEVARIGAGVDHYFHNDLSHPDMPDYKLYVFFNTFYLTNEEREAIHQKLSKNNATALWVYAPGLINPDKSKKIDVKNISELIGIDMARLDEKRPTKFRMNGDVKTFKKLDPDFIFGYNSRPHHGNIIINVPTIQTFTSPGFYSVDKNARNEAYYLINNLPAVTVKQTNKGFISIYHGAKVLRSDFVREAARSAGVHIYTESEDVFYNNENYICIHGSKTGEKTIKLKRKCSPYELYQNKYYAKDVNEFTFNIKKGETLMFRLD